MNRRGFLAALIALPAGMVAAAKAIAQPTGLNLDEILAQLYQIKRNREATLVMSWFQTTRLTHCSSLAYDDAIDEIMIADKAEVRRNWHERRKERARASIARMKTQRPLPLW